MNALLTYSEHELHQNKAYWTAKEICQQPNSWRETAKIVDEVRQQLDAFLAPILELQNLRIVLTGAGTSAYIGEAVAPQIAKLTGRTCTAISTTNIVSNPEHYLLADYPTLLISFGRSGNSPESLAAVQVADEIVTQCYHLVITCNESGQLAVNAKQSANSFCVLMPSETLDQSFAMTSSFTSMMVATMSVFAPDSEQLEIAANWSDLLINDYVNTLKSQANSDCERIVFLGAGPLLAIAKEAALKCLELTAGQVMSYCESPLGFRHGPKSLVNGKTEIYILMSNNDYTKQYDLDLCNEVIQDGIASSVVRIDQGLFDNKRVLDDIWAALPFIVYCQILSFFKSVNLSLSPDNPCPTGEVNRVVQGVTIYPLSPKGKAV